MIQVTSLSKEIADRVLFKDMTFTINKGERVGFVGRNGCGKSTLFKIIMGQTSHTSGDISIPKNYSIDILEQHIQFSKQTVLEECMQVLPKEFEFDNYRAEKILFGLGFSEGDLGKDPLSFSGGYQIRINLAKILLKSPDLLLLDEPTNYLDIVSMRWLEGFLRKYPGEIILITHDREFMAQVCTHTMGLHRQKLVKVKGTFKNYKDKIEEDEIVYENTRINQEKKIKDLQSFVDRFGAKASKAVQAQSKAKQIEKMDTIEKLLEVGSLDFSFNYKEFQAKTIVRANDLSFGYDPEKILFDKLSFYINKGDKIAIIGKNGKGKSTLLNIIANLLSPIKGNIETHPSMAIGHFGQTNINRLSSESTIEEEILSTNADLSHTRVRNICGTMMFSGDDAKKKISVLSGGEKSRVLLGKILAQQTNLLLLDEPTNHLDQESIDALISELNSFEGAAVIVTHSELILREFAKKFIIFHHDKCEEFLGSYDDFLEKIGWEDEVQVEKKKEKLSSKEYKHLRSETIKERSKKTKPLKIELENIENSIMTSENLIEEANEMLIKASENEDADAIQKYSIQLSENEEKVNDLFEKMEIVTEELNKIENEYEIILDELK